MQNILVVEDHFDARNAIRAVINRAFHKPSIDAVATLEAARQHIKNVTYDLAVLDLNLPDGNGEDFILEILAANADAYIVISTIYDASERLQTALQNGAKGSLLKEQPAEELIEEFKGIERGKPPLAPAITRQLVELVRSRSGTNNRKDKVDEKTASPLPPSEALTERESEILTLLAKGFNRPEITGILAISKHTVATHAKNIYKKLDIDSRSEATLIALNMGLL